MYNYSNLNDLEFENLCRDIMEKKLSLKLRIFAKGRDGGIDLTNNTVTHEIIVQIKHYINSKFSNLRTTLKNEITKVRSLNPTQYYVCCSLTLTANNITEIYHMFSDYMESDYNIITLNEIDEFLQIPENIDVVRKHYKLWLYASNILNEILNQDIFVDCEVLLSDIKEEAKYFVQTEIYNQCIEYIDKNRLLFITGGPGVGKTITSKMLLLYYASQNYSVRYTTNGDISNLKKSLSKDPNSYEIVLLDDCLGQHYFNMKSTQETELLTLLKFVSVYKNKKIILNSRVTIFNEARDRSNELSKFIQEKKIKNYVINMNDITMLEKAHIFYNHLKYKDVAQDYFESVKKDKKYMEIIKHENYTPRIIEHVTRDFNYLKVSPEDYFDYIINNFSNPYDIWKNEFERRLKEVDRAFVSTLYSLTDTSISISILKKSFEERISNMMNVDNTIDNFSLVLNRLNQSIILILDDKGEKKISVINPSVNDYMKSVLLNNVLELKEIRKSIVHFNQFGRCYSKSELPIIFIEYVSNGKILKIDFFDDNFKYNFIVSHICKFSIKRSEYKKIVYKYLINAFDDYGNDSSPTEILQILLNDYLTYYDISSFVLSRNCVEMLFQDLHLEYLVESIIILKRCYIKMHRKCNWFTDLCEIALTNAVISYVDNLDVDDYEKTFNMENLIQENLVYQYEDSHEVDRESIAEGINLKIEEIIKDEINGMTAALDTTIKVNYSEIISENIYVNGTSSYIDSYLEPDYDDDERWFYGRAEASDHLDDIEAMFER